MATQYVDMKSGADAAASYTGSHAGIGVDSATGLLYVNPDGTRRQVVDTTSSQTLTSKSGVMLTKIVAFTEDATSTSHVGTVTVPAGAWIHNISVTSGALWGAGTATLKVGDTADDDGYFTGVNLKATDLLVGEVLNTTASTLWGGKEGAYLVAATGRRGPTTDNFGQYYAAGSDIVGTITVGTPAVTTGRTYLSVTYSVGEALSAVKS